MASDDHQVDVRHGSWLRENSEIELTNGNFLSTSINLENKSAGDGCRDKTIKKTILRALRALTFSRGLGQKRKSRPCGGMSALRRLTDSNRPPPPAPNNPPHTTPHPPPPSPPTPT